MRGEKQHRKKRILITGFGAFLLLVLAFAVFFALSFKTIEVQGDSMTPTFNSGDRLLVSSAYWLVGDIRKNDLIVLKHRDTGEVVIKRVYAMGGEVIDFANMPQDWDITRGEFTVPDDNYYVLGDNRLVSEDSRDYGPVPREEVIGKVVIAKFGLGGSRAKAATQ